MGIKGLYKFLKTKHPQLFEDCRTDDYRGKRVAIDTFFFLYKYIIISDNWLGLFCGLINSFLSRDITPIFVLDGQNKGDKEKEIQRRRDQRNKMEQDAQDLEDALAVYLQTGTVTETLKKHMGLLVKYGNKKSLMLKDYLPPKDPEEVDVDGLTLKIERMRKQTNRLTGEHIQCVKELLNFLSIECVQADADAELACHTLYLQNKVDAIVSSDSDFLCYGTPVVLISWDPTSGKCVRVCTNKVLEALKVNQKEFLDFCIMCGTDYNPNIPRVGPVLSYKQIQKHRTLENVEETKRYDLTPLQYQHVRKIYTNTECKMEIIPHTDVDPEDLLYFLDAHGLGNYYKHFQKVLHKKEDH